VDLIFLVGLFAVLGDPALVMGDYSRLRGLLVLPLLGAALGAAAMVFAILAWSRPWWRLPARLHYAAVALATVGFTWFAATWNLLGFHL
jgi:hypothetical protein